MPRVRRHHAAGRVVPRLPVVRRHQRLLLVGRFVAGILLTLGVVALLAAACGEGGERSDVAGLGPGALDDLPRADDSSEPTAAAVSGDAISQGFTVGSTTPLEVLRFYRFELPRTGWEQIGTVDAVEGGGLRGRWWKGDRLLEVRADVPADEPTVRYFLTLRPVGAPAAGAPPAS